MIRTKKLLERLKQTWFTEYMWKAKSNYLKDYYKSVNKIVSNIIYSFFFCSIITIKDQGRKIHSKQILYNRKKLKNAQRKLTIEKTRMKDIKEEKRLRLVRKNKSIRRQENEEQL